MTQPKALIIDQITRIYKNNADRIIGLHTITIHEQREQNPNLQGKITNTRFKRHATISSDFTRFNLAMGQSRVISTVQMLGKYDEFTYNGSQTDIISVEYLGNNEVNSIEVSLKEFPTIGETL
jgi:hypothetical protein